MTGRTLICTDLDRTLLPNGPQPESAQARPRFRRLAARNDVHLAYVTGRDRALVLQAMSEFDLPAPEFVIGDVGTSIYSVSDGEWRLWEDWAGRIGRDWAGRGPDELHRLIHAPPELRLQEPEKQSRLKLSYYAPADLDPSGLLPALESRLEECGIRARLIWSLDETVPQGLLDVLPASAGKLHAIEFLMEREGFDPACSLFAGDSGNDLPVLTSPLQAVLVANATDEVRVEAREQAQRLGTSSALYLARGGLGGMNGNYSAGILEGLVHYIPEAAAWMD